MRLSATRSALSPVGTLATATRAMPRCSSITLSSPSTRRCSCSRQRAGIGLLELHHAADTVKQGVEQLVAVADVDVERRRPRVEIRRQPPHRHGVEPLLAQDPHRGVEDHVLAQRRLGGTVPGAARTRGRFHLKDSIP